LSKLVDLVELLHVIEADDAGNGKDTVAQRVAQYGLGVPVGYALECCRRIIGGAVLEEWASRYPVEESVLGELRDGKRRFPAEGSLLDRVFAEGPIRTEARGGWSRQFAKDQY
jgi:hypothetical protein